MGTLAGVAVPPEEFLRSRLSEGERASFADAGFLVVQNSVPAPTLGRVRSSALR